MLGLPLDEQILATSLIYILYCRNKKRIIIKDNTLYKQSYNNVGDTNTSQVILPLQIKDTLLSSLNGQEGSHPGISKAMQEIRPKIFFPSIANHVRKWVKECQSCSQHKEIDNSQLTSESISILEWDLGPEDVMQVDLIPEIPSKGSSENIFTTTDVFSRSTFAYPVPFATAINAAKILNDIMTRLAYLPKVMITDKGSVLVANVIHEKIDVLGITLHHATTKHAQTIGVQEKTLATIKTSLKMPSREFRKHWHKFLQLTILKNNTTYHACMGYEHCRWFHGRTAYNILDHKLGLKVQTGLVPTTDFSDKLLRRTLILYDKTRKMYCSHISDTRNITPKSKSFDVTTKRLLLHIENLKQITSDQNYHFEILDGLVLMQ